MRKQFLILTVCLSVVACNPTSDMDPALTAEYCSFMTEAQFNQKKSSMSEMFAGTIGGIPITALYTRENQDVSMPKRGVLKLLSGTSAKIGSGDDAVYVRARKDALVVRQKDGGPICGPVI